MVKRLRKRAKQQLRKPRTAESTTPRPQSGLHPHRVLHDTSSTSLHCNRLRRPGGRHPQRTWWTGCSSSPPSVSVLKQEISSSHKEEGRRRWGISMHSDGSTIDLKQNYNKYQQRWVQWRCRTNSSTHKGKLELRTSSLKSAGDDDRKANTIVNAGIP